MSTNLNVNESFSKDFLDRTSALDGTVAAIGLLIAVGLVLFAVGMTYLNSVIAPTDLPFLGQFMGS